MQASVCSNMKLSGIIPNELPDFLLSKKKAKKSTPDFGVNSGTVRFVDWGKWKRTVVHREIEWDYFIGQSCKTRKWYYVDVVDGQARNSNWSTREVDKL